MCTLTWLATSDGYEVFFNRDERRSRGPERPVAAVTLEGVRCLLPRDTDHHGTWIAANEHGVTSCLLNGYHAPLGSRRSAFESRGRLVLGLAHAPSVAGVTASLATARLEAYRPFVLASFGPGATGPLVHVWDGAALRREAVERPVVSSSADRERAHAIRRRVLARLAADGLDGDALARFHRSHEHGPSADSTCMHREDAETRSLCHVRVASSRVAFVHHHGAPCTEPPRTELDLQRNAAARRTRTP